MKFKLFTSIIFLIVITFNSNILNVFSYDPLGGTSSNITYDSKDYQIGGLTYTFYYGENHNIIGLNELDDVVDETKALADILANNNISINSYILAGNDLTNYNFVTSVKDIRVNGYTFSYFINKYAPNKVLLLNEDPFTTQESNIIINEILKGMFGGFYQIDHNLSSFNTLNNNLSTKLFLIKDNNVTDNEITQDLLNNVNNIFSLEFSNKINSHLQYYYRTKESLFGNKSEYLTLDFQDIEGSYSTKVTLINDNYNTLVDIINAQYTTEEKDNLDNNVFGFNASVDSILVETKNYAQTDYPNIFKADQKSSLFTDLNTYRTELLDDLNNYKAYLIAKRDNPENTNSGSIDYVDGISNSSGSLNFEYSDSGESYNNDLVGSGITDYVENGEDALHNLEDYANNDSRTIISKINNYSNNLGEKYDSREDYGLAIANNIERYTNLTSFLSGSTTLNDEIFVNSVNLNVLLKGDIKDEFVGSAGGKTVRDVSLQEFNNSYVDGNTTNFLLRKEIENYGKLMMNNQFLNKNIILPSTSKVNNDVLYKSYLKGSKGSYFSNYNKNSYVTVQERNDVEGFSGISFSYIPSPKQIKDSSNNPIGIQLGNNSNYYLTDTNEGIEINLEDGYDYDVNIRTYNGGTSGITLNLLDSLDVATPIVLKGDIVSKSVGKIKSKIVDSKNEDDSIKSLYVNDILAK